MISALSNQRYEVTKYLLRKIKIFLFPQVIKAGDSKELFQLTVRKEAWEGDRKLESFLTLDTNLTSVKIPLVAFDGKLQPVRKYFMTNNILMTVL